MTADALLLAHQGGWDEILLILTPIAIFAALLGLANRRANSVVRQRSEPSPDAPPDAGGPDLVPGDEGEERGADGGPPRPPGGGPAPD